MKNYQGRELYYRPSAEELEERKQSTMSKKIWNNIEIILITISMLLAMFTAGLILGVYVSSNTIEELSNDNIVKERTIQQQKERIRQLQLLKQYKEIYNA